MKSLRMLSVLALLLSGIVSAAEPQPPADFIALLAADLSAENTRGFLKRIDPAFAGYRELAPQIDALTKLGDLQSSIEIADLKIDGSKAEATLDWYLEIRPRAHNNDDQHFSPVRRRELVKCSLARWKNSWRVVRLEPVSFFAAPELK